MAAHLQESEMLAIGRIERYGAAHVAVGPLVLKLKEEHGGFAIVQEERRNPVRGSAAKA